MYIFNFIFICKIILLKFIYYYKILKKIIIYCNIVFNGPRVEEVSENEIPDIIGNEINQRIESNENEIPNFMNFNNSDNISVTSDSTVDLINENIEQPPVNKVSLLENQSQMFGNMNEMPKSNLKRNFIFFGAYCACIRTIYLFFLYI